MKKKMLLIVLTTSLLTACMKDYTCTCSVNTTVFETHKIHDTKKKAIQKCNDFSKQSQTTPWSEAGCQLK